MFDKGLIFRLKKGDSAKYGAVPFVVGSFEYQLKDMDREFAELFEQYFLEAFGKQGIGPDGSLANHTGEQINRPFVAGGAVRRREGNV